MWHRFLPSILSLWYHFFAISLSLFVFIIHLPHACGCLCIVLYAKTEGDTVDSGAEGLPPRPRRPVGRSKTSAASIGARGRRTGAGITPRMMTRRQTSWDIQPEEPAQRRRSLLRRNCRKHSVMDRALDQLPAIIEKVERPGSELKKTGDVVNQGFVKLRRKSTKVRKGVQQLQRKSTVAQEAFSEIRKTGTRLRRRMSIHDRMSNIFDRFKSSSLQAIQQGVSVVLNSARP